MFAPNYEICLSLDKVIEITEACPFMAHTV